MSDKGEKEENNLPERPKPMPTLEEEDLFIACRYGLVEEVERLIKAGVSVNAMTRTFETPLHKAAQCDRGGEVRSDDEEDYFSPDSTGYEPSVQIATILFAHGADVNAQNDVLETPLHLLCKDVPKNARLARLLIKHGANPHARHKTSGQTPVHYACKKGYSNCLKILLDEANADPNICDHEGLSPLWVAATNLVPDNTRLLIQHGATPVVTHEGVKHSIWELRLSADIRKAIEDN